MRRKQFVVVAFATLFCLSAGRIARAQDEFSGGFDDEEDADEEEDYGDEEEDYGDDEDYGDGEELDAPSGEGLTLTKGTMQVGGYITFDIDSARYGSADAMSGAMLHLSPTAGYFIIDHLELIAEVAFSVGFGDLYDYKPLDFYFGVGAKYFIPIGAMSLYAGGIFGFDFYGYDSIEVDETTGETTTTRNQHNWMRLSLPIGLLIPLNQWVGLDIGTRLDFDFGLGNNDAFLMNIPIGYLGVQGFFKLGD